MPGELARSQETSRSQNASTAGAGQADAHKSGPRETRRPPTHAHSSPAHERAGSHATRRPGRQQPSQAVPRAAPASGAAQAQDDEAGRQQDRGHGQHADRHARHRQPPLPDTLGRRPLSGARAPLRVLAATSTHHDLVVVAASGPTRGLRAGARAVRHGAAVGGRGPRSRALLRLRLG